MTAPATPDPRPPDWAAPTPKHPLFELLGKIPILGETADPVVATVLVSLVVLALIGVALPGQIFPNDQEARSHVLQIAGGLLVVVGAYWAAVNIRETRVRQYFERLSTAIDQIGSTTAPVRLGGTWLLKSLMMETPALPSDSMTEGAIEARKRAVEAVLKAVANEGAGPAAELAKAVLEDLVTLKLVAGD